MAGPRLQLTVGICDVDVAVGQRVDLEPEQSLRQARITVRCDACGGAQQSTAKPVFDTHDDDHYGRHELWYTTTHRAQCTCGAVLEIVLGHTQTHNLLTGGRAVVCDGVRARRGASLG